MTTLFETEETTTSDGLPPLTGTERQVPWAEQIRKGKMAGVSKLLSDWRALVDTHRRAGREEKAAQEGERYRAAVRGAALLEQRTHAGWWIDHRDNTAMELVKDSEAKPGSSFTR